MDTHLDQSDADLVRACRRGEADAWEVLVHRYRRLIYSVPVAYRLPVVDADDIFQRVSLKLFEHLGRLRNPEGLCAWLITTARRECRDRLRREPRTEPLEESATGDPADEPEDVIGSLHAVACEHALLRAFELLDLACRNLLSALYREDPKPSYREIAARLGRPVGSLGPTQKRCLAKLFRLYRKQGGLDP